MGIESVQASGVLCCVRLIKDCAGKVLHIVKQWGSAHDPMRFALVGRIRRKPPSGNGPGMWHWWKGSVHQALGSFINHLCGERDKGSGRAPLVNPRGPARKSVLRTALTSRAPDCGRLDSTYSSHPWDSPLRGQRKRCSKLLPAILSLSRFASVRHPWRPDLAIHAPVRRFQRGHNPHRCHIEDKKNRCR